jgi:heme exporter protein C
MLIPLLFILPRLTDSLHPGNGGNPGFNTYDLDLNMRKVFYPAVIGWALLGFWITDLRNRIGKIEETLDYE